MTIPIPILTNDASIKPLSGVDTDRINALLKQIAEAAAKTDNDKTFPEGAFGWLADAGLLGATLPGKPLDYQLPDTERLLQLLKRIGATNLVVGRVFEGHINALNLIHLYATPEQKKSLVRRCESVQPTI